MTFLDQWGPEIMDDPELSHRAHFQPWALGGTDMHGENDHPKWWTLDSLMKLNGAYLSSLRINSTVSFFITKANFPPALLIRSYLHRHSQS